MEASNQILDDLIKGVYPMPRAQNDLYAFARTVFLKLYSPTINFKEGERLEEKDFHEIKEFWKSVHDIWREIFDKAESSHIDNPKSYFDFAELLSSMLPMKYTSQLVHPQTK